MARMYSRKKGRSGSKRPLQRASPWVKLKPAELEEIIVKLARQGRQSAEIGLILRDQYGIPSTRDSFKARIARIMKKHGVYNEVLPEDMYNLVRRAVNLRKHMDRNKKDYTSYRGLELTESKIRRLAKFYKKQKALPEKWKWDPEKAKLWVK
jgi:small subunit ribosomal protein S15